MHVLVLSDGPINRFTPLEQVFVSLRTGGSGGVSRTFGTGAKPEQIEELINEISHALAAHGFWSGKIYTERVAILDYDVVARLLAEAVKS